MHQSHWGLRESPFPGGLDVRAFHKSPTHDEALARLNFLTDERRRLGLLLGGAGSGKSLLLRAFGSELRRRRAVVVEANLLGVEPHEFLSRLAAGLGITAGLCDTSLRNVHHHSESATSSRVGCLWRSITDRLAENRFLQLDTLVLLDDADEACPEVLEQVARLAQADNRGNSRLTIVLAADLHHWPRLGNRLLSLAELKIELHPWEPADTVQFVVESLRRAGREAPAFDEAALYRLHELTGGVPRRVSQLANLSLVAAAGQDLTLVDENTVDAVAGELGVQNLQSAEF